MRTLVIDGCDFFTYHVDERLALDGGRHRLGEFVAVHRKGMTGGHRRLACDVQSTVNRRGAFLPSAATVRCSRCRTSAELEQTSSAKFALWCAGVERTGRISYKSTATPRRAHCHAASEPASPAPMMRMGLGMNVATLFQNHQAEGRLPDKVAREFETRSVPIIRSWAKFRGCKIAPLSSIASETRSRVKASRGVFCSPVALARR